MFLVDFYNSSTSENRNERFMGELQNLHASSNYLLKLKPHKQRILKSVVTVFHYSAKE